LITVLEYFSDLASRLNLTEKQIEEVSSSRDRIVRALQSHPKIHLLDPASFYTGSYSRNTIIRPLDDIDLYVRINYSLHAENKPPSEVMWVFSQALRKSFPATSMRRDSPCVVVNFIGKRFEIVPAVSYVDNEDLYEIPTTDMKGWKQCLPNIPNKWITEANKRNGGLFVPLVKMIKQWVRNHGLKGKLKSFHVELLADMAFQRHHIDDYPDGLYTWLGVVHDLLTRNIEPFVVEPEGYGYVDEYLFENKLLLDSFKAKAFKSFEIAGRALNEWLKGHEPPALNLFRSILGPPVRPVMGERQFEG
jgi:hypothetical protein